MPSLTIRVMRLSRGFAGMRGDNGLSTSSVHLDNAMDY